jgi:hypothetical protein
LLVLPIDFWGKGWYTKAKIKTKEKTNKVFKGIWEGNDEKVSFRKPLKNRDFSKFTWL